MEPIRTIVCPTDFSEASKTAARYALGLARQLGAKVEFLHTYQLAGFAAPQGTLGEAVVREVQTELDAFVGSLDTAGVDVRARCRLGAPAEEIVTDAVEQGAQLIVMGTSGKTGIEHFLLGSVAERVVQSSSVPVLTVRHRG